MIREIHADSRSRSYGSPQGCAELRLGMASR
jgi:hypothetical protein